MNHLLEPRSDSPRTRRSAVLGACSFLGTHVVEVLTQAGHEVGAYDASSHVAGGLPDAFPEVLRGLGVAPQPWPLDWGGALGGAHFLFVVGGPRVQVEAALANVDLASFERAVLISSAEVYGEPGQEPFSEESSVAPGGGRARAFLDLEASLRGSELSHVVLRPTGTYGPRGRRGLREARRRVGISGPGSEARLGLVHARDVARAALHLAARAESAQATTYNLGDAVGLRQVDATRLVTRLAGHPHVALPWPKLPVSWPRVLRRRRDAGGALALSGGAPRVTCRRLAETGFDLEYPHPAAGLRETLAWFKQEGWL
jgi:nucleoside-diphosphate-sugar epimerase